MTERWLFLADTVAALLYLYIEATKQTIRFYVNYTFKKIHKICMCAK